MKLTVYTDGASRGNPGPASFGFVIFGEDGKVLYEEGKYLGINTNNFAEYSAVLEALRYLQTLGDSAAKEIAFFMDSKLVVEQLMGRFKIKSATLRPFVEQINLLNKFFMDVNFTHIPREKNKLADALANRALDSR